MKTIRFGIMGAGRIANKFCEAVQLTDGASLTAVSSKSPERAADFASRHQIPWYGTYEEMLARDDVDCVYVATTHNFHANNIRGCLLHGKHVICEKAMVMHESEAAQLFALAKERNLFLMEAMWSCFLPAVQWTKKQIEDGRIGELQTVNSVIGFRGDRDPASRLLDPALGGGAMYDIGVYPLQIVSYLVGEPIGDVQAIVRRHPVTGVDSRVLMNVRYTTVDASIQCMFTCNPKKYTIINGTKGTLVLPDDVTGSRRAVLYGEKQEKIEEFEQDAPNGNGFVYEVAEVVRCLNEGRTESDVMPGSATIQCARVFDKVLG